MLDSEVRRSRGSALPLSGDSASGMYVSSGATYQNTDKKYADAAYDYLKCGAQKWRIHVALADPFASGRGSFFRFDSLPRKRDYKSPPKCH
jgi:hypothetical protein